MSSKNVTSHYFWSVDTLSCKLSLLHRRLKRSKLTAWRKNQFFVGEVWMDGRLSLYFSNKKA